MSSKETKPDLRDEVLDFAYVMETKLRKHDHDRAWKNKSGGWVVDPRSLMQHLYEEVKEFGFMVDEICGLKFDITSYTRLLSEAADIANYLMMVCDVLKVVAEVGTYDET